MVPNNNLCKNFDSKKRWRSLSGVRFRKFKTLSYDLCGDL